MVAIYTDDDGSPDALVVTYRYDGLNRRIRKLLGTDPDESDTAYDYYYSGYQVVEASKDGDGYEQYVWDGRYVHSPALRWRDADDNGSLEETLYYCNDANFNMTALVATDGDVVERYRCDPYGKVTVLHGADDAERAECGRRPLYHAT